MTEPLQFVSLFAGIGGIDLGLERAGMRCVGQVEINPFCQRVLAKHWPDVPRYNDVRAVNANTFAGTRVDLIAGGFPCQDISVGGAGEGLEGERSGLWREFYRLIREVRPSFVLVENVSALLARGVDRVLGHLADIGFDAEWRVFSAAEFGAPHRRERLFVVAYPNEKHGYARLGNLSEWPPTIFREGPSRRDELWLQAPAVRSRVDDGVPSDLYASAVGALGNAVVPQVAEWIGRRIVEAAYAEAPCSTD